MSSGDDARNGRVGTRAETQTGPRIQQRESVRTYITVGRPSLQHARPECQMIRIRTCEPHASIHDQAIDPHTQLALADFGLALFRTRVQFSWMGET